jgi:hypothetical protein
MQFSSGIQEALNRCRTNTWQNLRGKGVICPNREPYTLSGSLKSSFQLHTQSNIGLYLTEATRYLTIMVTILYNMDSQLYNLCASAKIYMKKTRLFHHNLRANLKYLWVIRVCWHWDIRRSRRCSFQNVHLTAHHSDISVQMKQVTKLGMPTVKIWEPC